MRGIDLHDKVVLITGASSGIGEAAVKAFDRAGARIVLTARRFEKISQLAKDCRIAVALKSDLGVPGNAETIVDQTVHHFGRIDILINNAASIIVVPANAVTSADLEQAFRVNLLAPVAASQKALGYMKKQGSGQIINIGSPGFMMGIPFYTPYVCSKAAFSAWTRSIQAEWEDTAIIVSEYFPGYILTDSRPESRVGDVDQDLLMNQKQNFLTRLFSAPKTPEKVAEQIVKLARHPKTIAYSGFSVRLGTYISNISSFRLSLAKQMAMTAASKIPKLRN